MNAISNFSVAGAASTRNASAQRTSPPSWCRRARSAAIACAWVRSRSRKTAARAPRDKASMPSAPLPANASSTRAPSITGASQSNSVWRKRCGVGRNPGSVGTVSFDPRRRPPMMRTCPGGVMAWPRRSMRESRTCPFAVAVVKSQDGVLGHGRRPWALGHGVLGHGALGHGWQLRQPWQPWQP